MPNIFPCDATCLTTPNSFLPKELLVTLCTYLPIKELNRLCIASVTFKKVLFEATETRYIDSSFTFICRILQSRTPVLRKVTIKTQEIKAGPLTFMEYRICQTQAYPPPYTWINGIRLSKNARMSAAEWEHHKINKLQAEKNGLFFSTFTCLDWRGGCCDPSEKDITTPELLTVKGPVYLYPKALKGLQKFKNIERLILNYYSEKDHKLYPCAFKVNSLRDITALVKKICENLWAKKLRFRRQKDALEHISLLEAVAARVLVNPQHHRAAPPAS